MKTFIISLFFLLGIVFTSQSQSLKKQELELDASFMKAVQIAENLDYEQLKKNVSDHHRTGFIVAANYYDTFESLFTNVQNSIVGVKSQKIELLNKKITFLSNNIGLITASGTAEIHLQDGRSFQTPFFWTFVYEKINGDWKVIHSHQSNSR